MNLSFRFLILSILLTLLIFNKSAAQKASFETNKGMTIGFGLGASSQQSDIANSKGGGFDFSLGSYLYKKENALFSLDWKFRFLAGDNAAHDYRKNQDGTFSNIRYEFFNYDLEMGLTLNRLRERTRIVIAGFAGIGINHGITSTDFLDKTGTPYDYSLIDPSQGRNVVYQELLKLTDGIYETKLINKAALMPTAGIYLGYQFSRSFSMGIEHKMNFSLSENNSFFGMNIDNRIVSGSPKDWNSYTSLTFRWILRGSSSGSGQRKNYTVVNTSPKVYNPPATERPVTNPNPVIVVSPPQVEIIIPSGSTYSTTEGTLEITAAVRNVKDKREVQVVLNNKNTAFDYNSINGNVRSSLTLAEGKNTLRVSCSNEGGSSRDELAIIYNKQVTRILPQVKFIEPPTSLSIDKNVFAISVQTKNVKEWQDVTVSVNGASFSNFNFSPEGIVSTNIPLAEGINKVQVTGKNEDGSASDLTTITYKKPVKAIPPAIVILNPGVSPFNTYEPNQEIKARFSGISSKDNVTISINGEAISGFTFDDKSLVVTAVFTLKEGRNIITITARNDAGQEIRTQEVIKDTKPCPIPVLKMIEPARNEVTTDNPVLTIRTEVSNIMAREQLSVTLNNRPITNFIFNGNEINYVASLDSGMNTFAINATNNCGTQKITNTIYYKKPVTLVVEKPCPKPGITFSMAIARRDDANYDLKGFVSNVNNKSDITVTVNDSPFEGFSFVQSTGEISSSFKFNPGSYTVKVVVKNECGSDIKTVSASVLQPCVTPQVTINLMAVSREDANYDLKGSVSNVKNKSDITVTVNDSPFEGFSFVPATGEISSSFKFNPGSYTVKVVVKNECGEDSKTASAAVLQPCVAPQVTINLMAVSREDANYDLKGSLSNVNNKSDITVTVNDSPFEGFSFVPATGEISSSFKFNPGSYTVKVVVKNECGSDTKIASAAVLQPCVAPQVTVNLTAVSREDANYDLKGSVSNVKNKSDITVTVNDSPFEGFSFVPATGDISSSFKFNPGSYIVKVVVKNECGEDSKTASAAVLQPCVAPQVTINLTVVSREDANYDLKGSVSNVKNKSDITVTVNDSPFEGFSFVPSTGEISSSFKFNPGSYTIMVVVKNECGQDIYSGKVVIEEEVKPCGIRINPGNSSWEFCMITPSGTIGRDTLTNNNFMYSGSASSLYFMPIAGGGDAEVEGKPYTLRPGQYYLFTGNLTVTISSKNPGSMGQWSVCIVSDKEPISGNGNNRPKSPCEEQEEVGKPKKDREVKDK